MNIKEFRQIVKRLDFKPIDNIESWKNLLHDSEGNSKYDYYNESDRLTRIKYFNESGGLTSIEYFNEVDDEWIPFYYQPGDSIDAIRAGKKYNESVRSYNKKYWDSARGIEMIPAIIAVNVPLYPIHINNIVFDNYKLFKIYHANEGIQFSYIFNKSLLEYFYHKKESALKLKLISEDIAEIDKQISNVKIWFIDNDIDPNTIESFISYNYEIDMEKSVSSDSKIIESETEKSRGKLKQGDAFALLLNLEKNSYVCTDDEEKIIDHSSFKSYRSKHIKRLVKDTFDSVFAELEKQSKMTHEKFFDITRPPSVWYKIRYIESFNFQCTNPLGKYFDKCKKMVFEKSVTFQDDGKRKKGFSLVYK